MKKETFPYVGIVGGVALGSLIGIIDAAKQAEAHYTFFHAFPTDLLTPALIGLGFLGFAIGKILSLRGNGGAASDSSMDPDKYTPWKSSE